MLKMLLVTAAIVAGLAYAKEERLFYKAGVLGTCQVVSSPSGDKGQWWSCREGVLSGYPNLRKDDCVRKGLASRFEVWRCPAPLVTAPAAVY